MLARKHHQAKFLSSKNNSTKRSSRVQEMLYQRVCPSKVLSASTISEIYPSSTLQHAINLFNDKRLLIAVRLHLHPELHELLCRYVTIFIYVNFVEHSVHAYL